MMYFRKYNNLKTEIELMETFINSSSKELELLKNKRNNYLKLLKEYKEILKKLEEELKNLEGIEYDLFYEIIVKGKNVTKAVDQVAFKHDLDTSTIWKNYYPKIKKEIARFTSENPL